MALPDSHSPTSRDTCVKRLLDHARNREAADTVTFARLIGPKLASGDLLHLGLARDALGGLVARHFPGTLPRETLPERVTDSQQQRFVDELRALLLHFERQPVADSADAWCLATIVATACLRPDHLWRDLGLGARADVSAILTRHYPALVARNVDGLRWKKFLAQQLALAHGRTPSHAPGCPGCEDFGFCFPDG
jgi:nitrogen fixation protein NifQ